MSGRGKAMSGPASASASAAIPSPCTGICTPDAGRRFCIGCARTLEEIGRWRSMSPAERAAIMAALPARRAASGSGRR